MCRCRGGGGRHAGGAGGAEGGHPPPEAAGGGAHAAGPAREGGGQRLRAAGQGGSPGTPGVTPTPRLLFTVTRWMTCLVDWLVYYVARDDISHALFK